MDDCFLWVCWRDGEEDSFPASALVEALKAVPGMAFEEHRDDGAVEISLTGQGGGVDGFSFEEMEGRISSFSYDRPMGHPDVLACLFGLMRALRLVVIDPQADPEREAMLGIADARRELDVPDAILEAVDGRCEMIADAEGLRAFLFG